MLDLVVRGGTVVDGTGAAGFEADVGIEDGRITAIGRLGEAESPRSLDATGLVVAPGFIDIHSHSDFTLLVDPRAQSSIAQGVTTEVVGNCGHGCAPITEPDRFDAHTRLHGIMNLSAALPTWAFEGGPDKLAARLEDPATRGRLKAHESIVSSKQSIGWDRVFLYTSQGRPDMVGKSFKELAPPGGDEFDAIFDVLLAEREDPHRSLIIAQSYEEEWLRQTFQHPLCTLESDATALGRDGPLAGTVFLGAYTWAAWFFRRFVRDLPDFTVEEAVHKLTAMPAQRVGLTDRGRLAQGARADIVVFDPARFRERGTLEDPNHLAEGVSHVVVNGGVAMENGAFTGDRSGRVVRQR